MYKKTYDIEIENDAIAGWYVPDIIYNIIIISG